MDTIWMVIPWFCFLIASYSLFTTPTRFILQNVIILPIFLIASFICFIIGTIIKYLPFIPQPIRIYTLGSIISYSFWRLYFFFFDFWANQRLVISFGGDSDINFDDIVTKHRLNTILICNHSTSPLDYVCATSVVDYLGGIHFFAFVKKAFLRIPALGWVGGLVYYKGLNRDWNKDKLYISNLAQEFIDNVNYKLVTPWTWMIYPEGTRMTNKKLIKAQAFAKEKGLTVYNNLLQPRVKGFSFLTHKLHDALGCVIDLTAVYNPAPPQFSDFFIRTRLSKYVHLHVKLYQNDCLPKDIEELNQWLRERWTEKENIIQKMKQNKIKYKILKRSPYRAMMYFIFWAWFIHFIWCHLIFGVVYFSVKSTLILVFMLFPVVIVLIEQSQNDASIDINSKTD